MEQLLELCYRRDLAADGELRRRRRHDRPLDRGARDDLRAPRRHPRLGVCLDSCHLYVSGVDVTDPAALDACLDELDCADRPRPAARAARQRLRRPARLEPRPAREHPRGRARREARRVPLQSTPAGAAGGARDRGTREPRPGRGRDPQDEGAPGAVAGLTTRATSGYLIPRRGQRGRVLRQVLLRSRELGRSGRVRYQVPAMYVRGVSAERYRWVVLAAGTFAQACFSASTVGLPALGPALKSDYGLTLGETGVVLAATGIGNALHTAAVGARRRPRGRALGDRDRAHRRRSRCSSRPRGRTGSEP